MSYRVRFTGREQADLEEFELPELKDDQVRVRAHCSLMSTGTEGIVYARLFDEGTHWDRWVKYPFYPGYAMIGTIEAVGSEVSNLSVGQTVAVRHAHASACIVPAADAFPVPEGVDLEQASWFALAKIASHGMRIARHWPGQSVAVVGAGPVGQMALRWAAASGVTSLTAVDPVAGRLELARAGGATAVVCERVENAQDAVWEASLDGSGPDVVIEVTGHPAVFAPALALPRRFGQFVLLGDAGSPARQHLTPDVVIRGITVSGVHDSHNDDRWNNATAIHCFFQLLAAGRFPLEGLITHRLKPSQASDAYALAASRREETMGLLFDWS